MQFFCFLMFIPLALFADVMDKDAKIYVAGHKGLVGRAIVRKLEADGYTNLVFRTSKELDLTNQAATKVFFDEEMPEYVFLAAAKVGGIGANSNYPGQFIYENLMIQSNVMHQAYLHNVKKLLFLGSSCIYPKHCPQPIKEEYLLTGPLETTNKAYALAKIAGIEMCESYNRQYGTDFISCMPTNLYGPYDRFDSKDSHVMPAIISKIVHAKENNEPSVSLWGDGTPMREFLHCDDLGDAAVFLMNHYSRNETINIGTGMDMTIAQLADYIKEFVGYEGKIIFDTVNPNGTPKKLQDITKLKELGWQPKISIRDGIQTTIEWYLNNR